MTGLYDEWKKMLTTVLFGSWVQVQTKKFINEPGTLEPNWNIFIGPSCNDSSSRGKDADKGLRRGDGKPA
jgi:hypothetical protein